jgi:hypothetical protein
LRVVFGLEWTGGRAATATIASEEVEVWGGLG